MSENKENTNANANEKDLYEVKKKGPHRDPFRRAGSVVVIDNIEFIVIKPHGNGRWWLINRQATEARLLRDFHGSHLDMQALQTLAPLLTSFPIYAKTWSQVKQKSGRRRGGSRTRRPLSPVNYSSYASTTTPTPNTSSVSSSTLAYPSSPSSPLSPSLQPSNVSGSTSSRSLTQSNNNNNNVNKRKSVSDEYHQPPSLLSSLNNNNTTLTDTNSLLTQQLALLQQQLADSQRREQHALFLQQQAKKEKEDIKKENEEMKKENEEMKKEKDEVIEQAKKLQKRLTAVEYEVATDIFDHVDWLNNEVWPLQPHHSRPTERAQSSRTMATTTTVAPAMMTMMTMTTIPKVTTAGVTSDTMRGSTLNQQSRRRKKSKSQII